MKIVKNVRSFGYTNLSDNFDIKADKRSFVSTRVHIWSPDIDFTRKYKSMIEAALDSYQSNDYDAAKVETTNDGRAIIEVRNVHPTIEKLDEQFDKDAANEVLNAFKSSNIRAFVMFSCVERHIPGEYTNCARPNITLKNY